MDDEYLNGYARLCGVNATVVYLCLCRHASRDQESFPSVKSMAEKTGISRDSVMRGIKILEEWNIISKHRERRTNATWLNNNYTLMDKSVWKSKPSSTQQPGAKSLTATIQVANEGGSQVAHSDTKVSHKKEAHISESLRARGYEIKSAPLREDSETGESTKTRAKYKDARTAFTWFPFQELSWKKNITELECGLLLFERGEEDVRGIMKFVEKQKNNPHFGYTINKPSDLERKWRDIQEWDKKNRV